MSKEEILQLATNQMMCGGFDALNFRKISEELEISKANIHHHYGSKENLAFQVVSLYANERLSEMKRLQILHKNNFKKFMTELEDLYWETVLLNGDTKICVCSQILNGAGVPEEILEFSRKHFEEVFDVLLSVIKSSFNKDELKMSYQDMTKQTFMMMHGYMDLAGSYESIEEAKKNLYGQIRNWTLLFKA